MRTITGITTAITLRKDTEIGLYIDERVGFYVLLAQVPHHPKDYLLAEVKEYKHAVHLLVRVSGAIQDDQTHIRVADLLTKITKEV